MTAIEDGLRSWAKGIHASEAGVELLIRHGKAVYEGAPWLTEVESVSGPQPLTVAIDVEVLMDHAGVWSGGEQRVVRIAASLLGGPPVDLSEELPGLDRRGLDLVLAAVAHAGASHEHSEVRYELGHPTGFVRLGPLYEWPS